ncbi:MAG: glucosaminidase domain-containing protein [Lachnospiraceae bacterium]|nr:glucosaminidase domain-containing protein [Lachnospiraceae bacterium]
MRKKLSIIYAFLIITLLLSACESAAPSWGLSDKGSASPDLMDAGEGENLPQPDSKTAGSFGVGDFVEGTVPTGEETQADDSQNSEYQEEFSEDIGEGHLYTHDIPSVDVSSNQVENGPQSILYLTSSLQASDLKNLSDEEILSKIGPLFTLDQMSTNVLASVSLAQFIKESNFGRSDLAQKANNCFGLKCELSDNDWPGSTWDRASYYRKKTSEEDADGKSYSVVASFRAYRSIQDSIVDHSAYLLRAERGKGLRYKGIEGEMDPERAVKIIVDGGYATDSDYGQGLLDLISRYHLTRFDLTEDSQYDLGQYLN